MSNVDSGIGMRKFGIELVGDVSWGTHLCQFYETKRDLVSILVPYFAEGLRSNEFCMWITSPPLEVDEAKEALTKKVPDLQRCIMKGQIEFVSFADWYLLDGVFDADRVLRGWVEKEENAIKHGFEGLRLTGNTFWIERKDWKSFADYEASVNSVIGSHKMIALCTYSLKKCSATDIVDVMRNHVGSLIRRGRAWNLVEDVAVRKKTELGIESAARFPKENPNPILRISRDGVLTYSNPVAFSMLNELGMAIGKPVSAVWRKRITEALKLGVKQEWEEKVGDRTLLLILAPLTDYANIYGVDITRRKLLEDQLYMSEKKYRTLYETMVEGVVSLDMEGRFVECNKAYADMLGYSKDEVKALPCDQLIEDKEGTLERGYSELVEKELVRKDGEVLLTNVRLWLSRDENGAPTGMWGIVRDITKRKMAEKALKESQADLVRAQAVSKTGSWRLDVHKNELIWSDETYCMFAVPKGTPLTYEAFLNLVYPDDRELVDKKWKAALPGQEYDVEHRIIVNGEVRWVREKAELEVDRDGMLLGGFGTVQDITERKRMEQKLLDASREWERTFESVPDLIAILDNQHRIVRANRAMAQQLGLTPEQCFGLPCYKYVHGTDQPPEFCPHAQTLKDCQQHMAEVHEDRLGGDFLVSTTPLVDEKGQMIGSVHVARDINQRKKAEQELKMSERNFRTLAENAPDVIMRFDRNLRVTYLSPQAENATGIPSKQFIGKTNKEMNMPPDLVEKWNNLFHEAEASKHIQQMQFDFASPDGTRTFDLRVVPEYAEDGSLTSFLGISRDVTDLKKASETLRETRDYLDNLLDYANAPIIVWDPEFEISLFNHAFERLTGLNEKDVIGKKLEILFPQNEKDQALSYIQRALEGERMESVEIPIRHSDGTTRIALWNSANIQDTHGNVMATIAQGQDITERKKIENQLRETRDYLDSLLNYANAPIIVWDPDFKITMFNHAFERLTGFSSTEAVGKPLDMLFPKEQKEDAMHHIQRTLAGERWETVEIPIIHKDGTTKTLLWNSANIYDRGNKRIIATIAQGQDITERKEMEASIEQYAKHLEALVEEKTRQLKDAERLSAIGQTAGMVGHDIRNPLQSILTAAFLIKDDLAVLPENEQKNNLLQSVTEIEEQSAYINKIVADLQDYARTLRPYLEEVDIERLINNLLPNLKIPQNIEVNTKIDSNVKKMTADSGWITRILNNLIVNSIQAMPNGGKLTISTRKQENEAIIMVEDTGTGIPDDVKSKVFEPLFTTKSKGQGFGLAVVKRLAEALGGTITFESQQDKGTTFTLRLPSPNQQNGE